MSTSGSSGSSRGRLPNTEALLMNTTPRSSSSSRRSLRPLSAESLSSTGTSSSSTGSVLPNTMKLLRVPATLVSPRPRSPGSPRRRSPRARSSGSPRRSSSPGSPQPPGWYRASRSPKLGHRHRSRSRSRHRSRSRSRSRSGWSSASPVFRKLNFTIKKKGDERATVFRVPRIAPPPAGALRPYRLPPQLTRRSSIVFSPRPSPRSSSSSSLESPISLSPEVLKKLPFSFGQAAALAAARGSPKGAKGAKGAKGRSLSPEVLKKMPFSFGQAAAALAAARGSPKGAKGAKNRSSSSSFDSSN